MHCFASEDEDASSTDEVFAQFLTLCDEAGPERCALAGHGETAEERFARLAAQLQEAPIPAPDADPPGELRYADLLTSSFAPLRNPHLWADYAEQLNAAVEGDVTDLATVAQLSRTPAAFAEATKSASISCLDGPATRPVTDWPAVIGELVASSTILLIGTRYDPNTSYQNAVRSEQLLGNAVLLTHQGYGHLSLQDPSACIEEARQRYLVDLEVPPPPGPCARPTRSRSTTRARSEPCGAAVSD